MRKKAALLLALFLLLSACAVQPAAVSPSPAEATPTPSPKDTPVVSPIIYLPGGALPSTTYTPPSHPERFNTDPAKTLKASTDYGHIWPFIGAYFDIWSGRSYFYGICDDKGRVICEPVYNNVQILGKDGEKLFKLIKRVRVGDEHRAKYSKITLARPDGSWTEEYDEVITTSEPWEYPPSKDKHLFLHWRSAITNEYITVRKNDKWGAIDYRGNEILPCVYNAPLCFSEGLASILSDDGSEVSYIDSHGNTILGPYQTPPKPDTSFEDFPQDLPINYGLVFNEGRVRYYKDGKYGVIDHNGIIVVETKYDYISSYSDGTAEFVLDGKTGVIDLDGKVLLEPTDKSFEKAKNGLITMYEKGGTISINLSTGERTQLQPYNYSGKYSYKEGIGITLKLPGGDKIFPDAYNAYELKNNNFILNMNRKNSTWSIINSDGNCIAGPIVGDANSWDDGLIYVRLGDPYDKREYEYWSTIYTETGKRILPEKYLYIEPFEGLYIVRTDTYGGIVDENGRWIIKTPLYEYMGD